MGVTSNSYAEPAAGTVTVLCAIERGGTSLNLPIGPLYHRRMDIDDEGEKVNDFSQDEY